MGSREINILQDLFYQDRSVVPLGGNGLEHIETVSSRGRNHPWDLRMPMQLLDMLLSLMHKEELRRNDDPTVGLVELLCGRFFLISFN